MLQQVILEYLKTFQNLKPGNKYISCFQNVKFKLVTIESYKNSYKYICLNFTIFLNMFLRRQNKILMCTFQNFILQISF